MLASRCVDSGVSQIMLLSTYVKPEGKMAVSTVLTHSEVLGSRPRATSK